MSHARPLGLGSQDSRGSLESWAAPTSQAPGYLEALRECAALAARMQAIVDKLEARQNHSTPLAYSATPMLFERLQGLLADHARVTAGILEP